MKIVEKFIYSSLIRRRLPYLVMLPHSFQRSEKFYPVLYLLHGLFGSYKNWFELTQIKSYAEDTEFVIVLPEAGDSWYTNSQTNETEKFESYFIKEFFDEVETKFRISRQKNSRAICGLSMGGFGALKFAFKYPDLFIFSGSMSGAFNAARQSENNYGSDWESLSPSISRVFGSEDSFTRKENDLFGIVDRLCEQEISTLPEIYFSCGKDDNFLSSNRELSQILKSKNIKFEYQEKPGLHDWNFWNKELKELLQKVSSKFGTILTY